VRPFCRLVAAYVDGEFRDIPRNKVLAVVEALEYFLSPFEGVVGFLPRAGSMDQAGLLDWIARALKDDLDRFLAWEKEGRPTQELVPNAPRTPSTDSMSRSTKPRHRPS
jgi:hypothetical protein